MGDDRDGRRPGRARPRLRASAHGLPRGLRLQARADCRADKRARNSGGPTGRRLAGEKRRKEAHAAPTIPAARRCWFGEHRRGGACHGSARADYSLATGNVVSKIARYALWRLRWFSKYLAEVSDQTFLVQVFAPGEVVPAFQVFDAVSAATLEMGNTASYYYIGKDLAFGPAVPFGFNRRQMNAWLSYGGGLELLNDLYKGHNVWGISFGNTTAQMGGWFRKEIKTVDDLKALKFRVGGVAC